MLIVTQPIKVGYIHIPRTGGKWVRRQFMPKRNPMLFKSSEAGGYHDVPENLPDMQLFYTYRSPASWYRSLWCSREASSWRLVASDSPKWDEMCDILNTLQAPGLPFPDFVEMLTTNYPGFMTDVFKWYIAPIPKDVIVHAVEIGEMPSYVEDLLKPYGIGVEAQPVGVSKNPPKITDELVKMIEESETEYVSKFGAKHATKKGAKRVRPDRSDNLDGVSEDATEHVLADSTDNPEVEDVSVTPSPAASGTRTGEGDITTGKS